MRFRMRNTFDDSTLLTLKMKDTYKSRNAKKSIEACKARKWIFL